MNRACVSKLRDVRTGGCQYYMFEDILCTLTVITICVTSELEVMRWDES
jgi:hypothetical protein